MPLNVLLLQLFNRIINGSETSRGGASKTCLQQTMPWDIRYKNQLDNIKRPFDVAKYDSAGRNRVAIIQLAIGHWLRILEFRYSTNYYEAAEVAALLPWRHQHGASYLIIAVS